MPQKQKAKKRTGRVGGFAGQNSGEIGDCYSIVKLNTPKSITGGFSGENIGGISHSFYTGAIRNITGGLTCDGIGANEKSYFFHTESEKSKKLEKLRDKEAGVQTKAVKDAEDIPEFLSDLGFDVEEIWEYTDKPQVMRFIPDKWLFDITESPLYKTTEMEAVTIGSADELFVFAKAVNDGDKEFSTAYIQLENDIDLKGKEWEPIGFELSKAFTGVFDGNGYKITNFKIKSKDTKAKGFFGYLKGEVYNLTVDCEIKTRKQDMASGGIAAYCENGIIGYCAAIINCQLFNANCSSGGLVAANTGKIFQSYAAGKISAIAIPWWWWLLPLLPLLLLLLLLLPTQPEEIPVFAPPWVDPNIERMPGDPGEVRTDRNFVSFEFEQEILVNLSTGECIFNFRNPSSSNHDIVVQLQMTDEEAIKAMGSTGRTAEEQALLERSPGYEPENYRTILAESGAIPVGHRLDNLILSIQPNGARLSPGEYPAIAFLIFYDKDSHSRAMLESQLPVKLIVN